MKMYYRKILTIIAILLLSVIIALPVFASTISTAKYHGIITITNNSTATTNVVVPFSANISAMIANGELNSTCTDSAILSTGTDVAYMPQYGTSNWWLFVSSIPASSSIPNDFYTGGSTSMASKIRYFPGATGMTTADNDTMLEPGANFSIEQKGWCDTTGATKYSLDKSGALGIGMGAGNIFGIAVFPGGMTQTLYPNGTGTYTEFDTLVGADTHWQANLTNDALTSHSADTAGTEKNTFAMDDGTIPSGSTIASVVVNVWAKTGGATDYLTTMVRLGSTDVESSNHSPTPGDWTLYSDSLARPGGGSWTAADIPNIEAGIKGVEVTNAVYSTQVYVVVTYTPPNVTVTATGVSSGEHTVILAANSTNLTISIDGVLADSHVLYGTIINNSSDWGSFLNRPMPYVEYQKIYIGGNLRQHIIWQYASTFTDQSGNGQNATPSFPTASSDADVSATLTSLSPISPSELTSWSVTTAGTILSGSPDMPSQMYTSGNYTRIPGAAAINEFLDEGGIPRALWWYPVLYGIIMILSFLFYPITSGGNRSVLFQCIITEVLMFLVGLLNPVPLMGAFLFPIAAIAIISSQKHQTVG